MLKELSKSGHGQQALELFDCLQNLPPNHDLAPLADVFSYTTGNPSQPSPEAWPLLWLTHDWLSCSHIRQDLHAALLN